MTSEPLSQTAGREGGFGGGVTELCRGKWGGPGVCGVLEKARTAVGDVTTGRSVMFPGGAVTSPCGTKGKRMSHIITELQAVDKRRIR